MFSGPFKFETRKNEYNVSGPRHSIAGLATF